MSSAELTGESITAEGIDALRAEVEELETTGRQEMAERIKAARELGDLKENAEYHIAKEDQAHLETRIKRLRERLRKAVVVEVDSGAAVAAGSFAFGLTAEVEDDAGKSYTWKLVGPTEADVAEGLLSVESPVGRALRDRAVGDSVKIATPRGERTYRIKSLVG
jgi:transcription elongation factor GreA